MIGQYYLILGGVLFAIGAFGTLIRRDAIAVFMCIELMLNAVNLTFVTLARELNDLAGQIFVFFVFAVAAAETAVGLAIILSVFRNYRSIEISKADSLHG